MSSAEYLLDVLRRKAWRQAKAFANTVGLLEAQIADMKKPVKRRRVKKLLNKVKLVVGVALLSLVAGCSTPRPSTPPRTVSHTLTPPERAMSIDAASSPPIPTRPNPKPYTMFHLEWGAYGPGSQFISYDVGALTNVAAPLSSARVLVNVVSNGYDLRFTNGAQLYPVVRVRDKDQGIGPWVGFTRK